jgi:hypothetical protein
MRGFVVNETTYLGPSWTIYRGMGLVCVNVGQSFSSGTIASHLQDAVPRRTTPRARSAWLKVSAL